MVLTGPYVQKEKAGVSTRAGWFIMVLIAFLMPSEKQRVPKACKNCMMIILSKIKRSI